MWVYVDRGDWEASNNPPQLWDSEFRVTGYSKRIDRNQPLIAAEGGCMDLQNEEGRGGQDHHHGHHDHNHGDHCEVRVMVPFNNDDVYLYKGTYTVETLKRIAKIPLIDDLDQLVGTKIVPLPDDGKHVEITGCEIFLYHPKDGGSS